MAFYDIKIVSLNFQVFSEKIKKNNKLQKLLSRKNIFGSQKNVFFYFYTFQIFFTNNFFDDYHFTHTIFKFNLKIYQKNCISFINVFLCKFLVITHNYISLGVQQRVSDTQSLHLNQSIFFSILLQRIYMFIKSVSVIKSYFYLYHVPKIITHCKLIIP